MTSSQATSPAPPRVLESSLRDALDLQEVAILAPIDVEDALEFAAASDLGFAVTMLDPWYNKGIGGVRDDYVPYIERLLRLAADVSDHVFLWGFPEVVARFVDRLPPQLELVAWLTWYYKNNPSVIRGWRSSQMACLHLAREGHTLYPEHFLNEAQLAKKAEGKLRYMPGPTSVIEAALQIGFVGRKEQTGHKAQKPAAVFRPLIEMTTQRGDLVFDPMAGSGTTAAVVRELGRRAIVSDHSEVYTEIMEKRLELPRTSVPGEISTRPAPVESAVPHNEPAVT
jgi:site-specific DNA-methyltransferase (adenine-specific)